MKKSKSRFKSHKRKPGKPYTIRFILLGSLIVLLGIAPLFHQFMSKHVDHVITREAISLKPGINEVGNLRITLDEHGVVTGVKKVNRHAAHPFLSFQNGKDFIIAIGPFLSILSLSIFLIWYDRQERYRALIMLKRYVLGVFLLTSIGLTYWALVPQSDPIPYVLYCLAFGIGVFASVVAVYFLIRHCTSATGITRNIVSSLKSYIHEVRTKHYFRVVMQALDKEGSCEETCQNIDAYEERTTEELDKIKDYESPSEGDASHESR